MAQSFGALLSGYREGRMAARMLAQRVGLSPAMISLFESDERRPSREQVLLIAKTLELADDTTDRLLIAAGHLAAAFDRVPPSDPDVLLVARVLADEAIPVDEKEHFRLAIRLASLRWRPGALDLTPFRPQLSAPD